MAIIPPPLKPGAVLAVVSPAGPVNKDEVDIGINALSEAGFHTKLFPSALEKKEFLAGDDPERLNDLQNAFLDKETEGILCTRGGYGSTRLIDQFDYNLLESHPKPFIGFSDLTAFQHACWKRKKYITFSGPQLARGWGENLSEFSKDCWIRMLTGEALGKPLPLPGSQDSLNVITSGSADGWLAGGNLSMLAALCGTKDQPSLKDCIVLIEEIDEPLYRIDRLITQLRMCGVFEGVKGIVLGKFVQHLKGEPVNQAESVISILKDALKKSDGVSADQIPVLGSAPYGHVGDCWTVALGTWAELDGENGSISLNINNLD